MYPNSNSGACARDGNVRGADIRRPGGANVGSLVGWTLTGDTYLADAAGGRPAGRPRWRGPYHPGLTADPSVSPCPELRVAALPLSDLGRCSVKWQVV